MVAITIDGAYKPWPLHANLANGVASTNTVIDATGEKIAWLGRVWNKDGASKSITKIHFKLGTVTKAGGSALTLSLQDVDLTTGPIMVPDGIADQTVAIPNDANLATGLWYTTAALSASRSVTFGELLAVVLEYDGAGRLGSDAINVVNAYGYAYVSSGLQGPHILLNTGTWAGVNAIPNIILEFTDGTFGTFDQAMPGLSSSTLAFNSTSAADEAALEFTTPYAARCDGCWIYMAADAGADLAVVLYDGTTAVATTTIDANALRAVASPNFLYVTFPAATLAVGSTYRLAVKPTTTNNVTVYFFNVSAAGHLQAYPGGQTWCYATRVDAGAWTTTTTRRPLMGVRVAPADDGGGSGGGGGARVIGG